MARRETKHASIRPSQAEEGGGKFTIPAGSTCEITEILWTTWADAGEGALKGGRDADDPACKITVDIEDGEETTEFLGAGKKNRLEPSSDGEFLEPVDGSGATALTKGSNSNIFFDSICDKKAHGRKAVPEDLLDDGISALTGLKFVAGRKKVERDIRDDGDDKGRKGAGSSNRPTLVAEEILELPGKGGAKKKASRDEDEEEAPRSKRRARDEEEEEEERPAKKKAKGKAADADEADVETAAEEAVTKALELPKFRKGLPVDKAFSAVYTLVKGEDNEKEITELIEDEKWLKAKARPWTYDKEDDVLTAAD